MRRLLHDLGLSWQKARPVHPEADRTPVDRGCGPIARFKKIPALIAAIARDQPEAERLEVWCLDEARVGQTGRVCRRWFEKGASAGGRSDASRSTAPLAAGATPGTRPAKLHPRHRSIRQSRSQGRALGDDPA